MVEKGEWLMSKGVKLAKGTHTCVRRLALMVQWKVDPIERGVMLTGRNLLELMITPHPRLRSRTSGNRTVREQHYFISASDESLQTTWATLPFLIKSKMPLVPTRVNQVPLIRADSSGGSPMHLQQPNYYSLLRKNPRMPSPRSNLLLEVSALSWTIMR